MILAFSLTSTAYEVYLVSVILGLGVALNNAPIDALLADCVIAEIRAKVMGGYEVIVGLGRTLGVLLLGGLYSISSSAPFNLLGALMFLTVGLVAVFVTEPRSKAGFLMPLLPHEGKITFIPEDGVAVLSASLEDDKTRMLVERAIAGWIECPACRRSILKESRFCDYCGASV
jgi:MFS family permease